jgi:hypothetical protein
MSRLYHSARPVEVQTDEQGVPAAVCWRGVTYRVSCHNHWRIHTRWWEDEVRRDYYLLAHKSGNLVCEVYFDVPSGEWFMHRIYD